MMNRRSTGRAALAWLLAAGISACESPGGSKYPPPVPPDHSQWTPQLLSPPEGAVMDNGRIDGKDAIEWDFEWSQAPQLSRFEIEVWGPHATIPMIKATVFANTTKFRHTSGGYIIDVNRKGWKWKVRAGFEFITLEPMRSWTEWRPWSAERTFDVEPVDTDPAR